MLGPARSMTCLCPPVGLATRVRTLDSQRVVYRTGVSGPRLKTVTDHVVRRLLLLQPNGRLYESFSVFCPLDRLECLELLEKEDLLVDWSRPIFLNYTHSTIMDRLEEFYRHIGTMEKVCGDIYVCDADDAAAAFDQLQE